MKSIMPDIRNGIAVITLDNPPVNSLGLALRERIVQQVDHAQSANEARLAATLDWTRLQEADLVIEAVFEDLAVKQTVFRQIDVYARPGAILATKTSYLDVDAIAAATSRPQEVLGLHFFSPANVMKLLEVVRGSRTAPDVLATGMAVGAALKKTPVFTGNAFGFIGNRIYNAYRRQCEFMLEDGAWPEDVDDALTRFGFAMGPFAVADLSGLDIAWRMRKAQAAHRDSHERYVDILDRLCEMGAARAQGRRRLLRLCRRQAGQDDGCRRARSHPAGKRAAWHRPAAADNRGHPAPYSAGDAQRGGPTNRRRYRGAAQRR